MDIIIHRFVTAALDSESAPYTVEQVGVMFTYYFVYLIISAKIISQDSNQCNEIQHFTICIAP